MTTPTTSPAPVPPPPGTRVDQPADTRLTDLGGVVSGVGSATTSQRRSNTVGFLQRWNVILPVLIAATGLLGVVGSFIVQTAARSTNEATGPALIEVQDLFASVAEANTAATAAHLAVDINGVEDRASRNLYNDALRRSNQHLALVAADIGQDPTALPVIQDLGAALAIYSGEVEAARVAKLNGLPQADARLRSALDILNSEIGPSVSTLTTFGQNQYDGETTEGRLFIGIALAVGLTTLAAMIWMQVRLAQRTRRLLNPLLVLSTVALIGLLTLLAYGNGFRASALNDADNGGYDAIASTARLQNATFGLQANLALTLLDDTSSGIERAGVVDDLLQSGNVQINELIGQADSERETAAAETLAVRWGRYVDVVDQIQQVNDRGDRTSAVALFQTEGLSGFNGLNTAIESVLLDNRDQFSDGIGAAAQAVELNPWLCLLLTVGASLLAIVAVQRRLGDYR